VRTKGDVAATFSYAISHETYDDNFTCTMFFPPPANPYDRVGDRSYGDPEVKTADNAPDYRYEWNAQPFKELHCEF
jgi:hypothetical protein